MLRGAGLPQKSLGAFAHRRSQRATVVMINDARFLVFAIRHPINEGVVLNGMFSTGSRCSECDEGH